ncbi:hypothetical protein BGZ94_002210, partial [Podila epigama]
MSAKLVPPVTSPSMANLASKVINRLANHHQQQLTDDNESETDNGSNNNNTNNTSNNNNSNGVDEEEEEIDEDAGIIRCICGYTEDDGFTIQCERCFVWQHAVCVGIVQSNVPDRYLCELCSPRTVDRKRASEIQRRRFGVLDRRREKTPPPTTRRKQTGKNSSRSHGASSSSAAAASSLPSSSVQASSSSSQAQHHLQSSSTATTGTTTGTSTTQALNNSASSSQFSHQPSSSSPSTSSRQKGHSSQQSNSNHRASFAATSRNEDEDFDMDSDNSQEDLLDSYQFEFSSVDMNIVTSKAVHDLFRQIIAQFRQAQSRKRSLSITSGVKLQELVAAPTPVSYAASDSDRDSIVSGSIPGSPVINSTALEAVQPPPGAPPPGTDISNVVSMERESLARPLMKVTVKHILSSSKPHHSPAPQYGLFAESNISAGRFMMEFKGEVSLKSAYKSDPINQYSIIATPKPFVLFHPHLNLVVDARRSGNDARFARRSCFPNTEVKSIVVPGVQDQTVHLGLFAKTPIGKGQEITLDWDWKRDHLALKSLKSDNKSMDSSTRKMFKEIRKAKYLVASTLLAQTDCACDNKETCVLHQMMKDGMSEPSSKDGDSAVKGNRPKKTNSESLRQRYGNHRDRPTPESQDNKRLNDQDSSNDDDTSIADTTSRRKSPKSAKTESSSKKARHREGLAHYRTEHGLDSMSDSDDHRRRKQSSNATTIERRDPSSSRGARESLSTRELKQAMNQINRLEDKETSSSKQRALQGSSTSHDSGPTQHTRHPGVASSVPRSTRENNDTIGLEFRPSSPSKRPEDDNISIGDSGIDSDSNQGLQPNRETGGIASSASKRPHAPIAQGKRYRDQSEIAVTPASSVASDSDVRDDNLRQSKRVSGKRQPYSAASRGKRIAEAASPKLPSTERSGTHMTGAGGEKYGQVSGSSSVESSFVSIVGNTSDEEEEYRQRTGRQSLREKNLPKKTLPAASLKPSMLPCKKVWKMIYMKQRALAEAEALEKAEEMRRKAEEVFDIKMEEEEEEEKLEYDDSSSIADQTTPAPGVDVPLKIKGKDVPSDADDKAELDPVAKDQPTIVHEDILNLFHDDVQPGKSSLAAKRESEKPITDTSVMDVQMASPLLPEPTPIMSKDLEQPTTTLDASHLAVEHHVPDPVETVMTTDTVAPPQKLSLESYHAQRKASQSPMPTVEKPNSESESNMEEMVDVTSVEQADEDVEMTMAPPEEDAHSSVLETKGDDVSSHGANSTPAVTEAVEIAPAVAKVKLSLQEYQKKRQEASQRTSTLPTTEAVQTKNDTLASESKGSMETENVHDGSTADAQKGDDRIGMDRIRSDGASGELTTTDHASEASGPAKGDYFDVARLPTPLSGLSSRAQGGIQATADYFPVQPFSPVALSVGSTPFAKLNLTSSPPLATVEPGASSSSPAKSPVPQRSATISSGSRDKEQSDVKDSKDQSTAVVETRSEPRPASPLPAQGHTGASASASASAATVGWKTPRHQRGTSPQATSQNQSSAVANYRNGNDLRSSESRSGDGRLTSPRYYNMAAADRNSLTSPTRERRHSLTSGLLPTSPYQGYGFQGGGGYYGYNDDLQTTKRSGPLSSPTGPPLGPRDSYKGDERMRHRSMNGDEWGYSSMDQGIYGGYRGIRGAPPPPPRDRERDRERERRDR